MSIELRRMLVETAAVPRRPVALADVIRRGEGLRRRRVALQVAVAVTAVVALWAVAPAVLEIRKAEPPGADLHTERRWEPRAEVVARLRGAPLQIARGAGSIWAAGSDDKGGWIVSRVDEISGEVLQRTRLEAYPVSIAFVDGDLWVLTRPLESSGGTLWRIDPETDDVQTLALLDQTPLQLGVGDSPWVLVEGGELLRLRRDGSIEERAPVDIDGFAVHGDDVWGYKLAGRVFRLRPDGSRPASYDLPQSVVSLDVTHDLVVAVQQLEDGGLAVTGIPVDGPSPATWSAELPDTWGAVSIGSYDVWVIVPGKSARGGDGQLLRLDPDTGAVSETFTAGGGPVDVLATEETVWIANHNDYTLSRLVPVRE